jgi:hypothetical protein
VHVGLGHVLRADGRRREAAEAYRRALEIDARCREANEGIQVLEAATAVEGGAQ